METRELERHIRTLATLVETGAPVISCYLHVGDGPSGFWDVLDERVRVLRKSLTGAQLQDFNAAFSRIESLLLQPLAPGTQGLAIFAREGKAPFFLSLPFGVPVPNWIAVGTTPNIYHLVELRDNYDRYVILLATEASARIIAVNLGAATQQLLKLRPELRRRVGHEWTRDHFQDHRRERTRQFIHDQIGTLERVMSAGGYGHLILSGNARMIASIRKALPKSLAAKLVDAVPAAAGDRIPDIVAATLQSFLEHEESESQAIAESLVTKIRTHGLAVAGTEPTMRALRTGQADFLVLAKDYDPGFGWGCPHCGRTELELPCPDNCPACKTGGLHTFEIRGEMVRLAEQNDCGIEVVEHSDILMSLGGVGCLLRYLAPENYIATAA